jgi:hypothetical protein
MQDPFTSHFIRGKDFSGRGSNHRRSKLGALTQLHQSRKGKIVSRFGNASLIQTAEGKHELVGGSESDLAEAKEWISLFSHEIVFARRRSIGAGREDSGPGHTTIC